LVLDQCGAPTQSSWSGNKPSYIMHALKDVSDNVLENIAEVFGLDAKAEADQPGITTDDGRFNLFISHLSSHQKYAAELQSAFKKFGILSFVAHNDVEPTMEWQNAIENALFNCDALIALLHPGFHKSNWTDQEIGFVMGRRAPSFTVMLGETPYGFISRFQAFNGKDKTSSALANEIFEKLLENKKTSPKLSISLARALEASSSYARSVEVIGYLEKIEHAAPPVQARIEAALSGNSQVYGERLHDVPGRTKTLLKKWKGK
jgi:hypothetical protein